MTTEQETQETEPVIAAAVMASSSSLDNKGLAKSIEAAMSDAIQRALADGVPMEDTEEIKQRMLDAREGVLHRARTGVLVLLMLLFAGYAQAQTHVCDQAPPAAGTGTAGQTLTLSVCHPGTDGNGNAVTIEKVYDNGVERASLVMTKGTTPNGAGFYEFTGPYTVPATAGLHTLTLTFLSGTLESPPSNPFALTVSLPRTAPVAGKNLQAK